MTQANSKPIRLLVVAQYYYPEQFRINDMCAEWVKRGYDVTVVTGIPNYPQGKFFDGYGWFKRRKEVHNGVKIIRLPIVSRGSSKIQLGLNYVSFVVSGFFWQMFTKQKADVVFSFEVSPMTQVLPAVWFAKHRKISCIAYIQDLWPENFIEMTGINAGLIIRIIDYMTDYIYKNCQKILVTSNSFKRAVEERGVLADKVVFWPQYAEDFYKPSATVSPLVPRDNIFTIAYTGNIGMAQGLDVLPKAAVLLKEIGQRIRFLMVGDGRGMSALKKAIGENKVEEFFYFVPQQPPHEIPSILAGADAAFISFADKPLFSMTIPAKLQSYMACGMPIIAVADGEVEGIIKEANCGICCKKEDIAGLSSAIIQLKSADSGIVSQMAISGIDFANRFFNKTEQMEHFTGYLEECLK